MKINYYYNNIGCNITIGKYNSYIKTNTWKNLRKNNAKATGICRNFVKENGRLTATECAKQAGYSEKSAISQASVMRNPKYFPHVVKAIEDLQREYAEASKIDFVKHSRELARLRDQAVINGQIGPAVNAEYRRGQLAGFYVDRKEVVTASLDNMSRPELEAKLKEIRDHNVINGESIGVEIKEITEEKEEENNSVNIFSFYYKLLHIPTYLALFTYNK